MELLRGKFIQLKNDMTPIVLCISKEGLVIYEDYNPSDDPEEYPLIRDTNLAFSKNLQPFPTIIYWFKPLREEIELNLTAPIDYRKKREYLSEIIDFYSEVEGRIREDGSGNLSADFIVFDDSTNFNNAPDLIVYDFKDFLLILKKTLRVELTYLSNKVNELEAELKPKSSDIEIHSSNSIQNQRSLRWSKSDTDLLELIMSLYELGAIQNEDKNLTKEEAIQAFSNFFGKEIKDHYKKLNAARNRKKDDPDFLLKLQNALQVYYSNLDKKN